MFLLPDMDLKSLPDCEFSMSGPFFKQYSTLLVFLNTVVCLNEYFLYKI